MHEDRLKTNRSPQSLAILYLLYIRLGDRREALPFLEEYTKLARLDAEALRRLASLEESLCEFEQARKSYALALEIEPDNRTRLKYAGVLYRGRQVDEFLKVIEMMLKQPQLEREIATEALDKLWQAYCEEARVKDRLHFKNVLAIAYYRSEISDKAEELFLDILKSENSPGDIPAYLWNIYSLRQEYDKAARLFRAIFHSKPDDLIVFEYYVKALQKTGHAPDALSLIIEQRKKGVDQFTFFKLASLVEEVLEEMIKGDNMAYTLQAIEFLKIAPTNKQKNLFLEAEVLARLGEFPLATKAYENAFLRAPTDSETTQMISRRIKYFEKLKSELERKRTSPADGVEDFVDLIIDGVLYRIPASERAKAKLAAGRGAWVGEIEMIEEDLDTPRRNEALRKLERFVARCPSEHRFKAQILLAKCHFRDSRIVKALNIVDTITLEPVAEDNISRRYEIADLLEHHEQYAKALEIFEQIKSVATEYGDISRRIKRLSELQASHKTIHAQSEDLVLGNRFRVRKKLGEGGMSIVYLAADKNSGLEFAVKIPREQFSSNDTFLKRFRQEASLLLKLDHPNIIKVYEIAPENPPFIVMEFLEGASLRDLLSRGEPLSLADSVAYAIETSRALEYAHGQNLVHRDIKPENIFLTKDRKIKLMDFGIAKALDAVYLTATGEILGTLAYMSPEQCLGVELDLRSDIYSLGVTLYELATGVKPFEGGDVTYHHVHIMPLAPSRKKPGLPDLFDKIVMRCLEKEPVRRYPNATLLLADLRKLAATLS
jgi:tetratricopeptide (TPR) repeat protein